MPRAIQLTERERKLILAWHKKNIPHREIAKRINRSKTVVTNFLKDPLNYGSRKPTGRRKTVDGRSKRLIIRTASNKSIPCSNIISDLGLKMSRWTINRVIKRSNILKKMKKKRSPALTTVHKDLRLTWAKDHMIWNNEWYKVVWSDEKKIIWMVLMVFITTGMISVKRKRFFSTRLQCGGSVMIWASFG
ncbi:unnamed protein product [Rotaria socialis]|uniref:Transposase n=1 Tax=Rotaria socialis TaxID=392032 RepID=A0A818BFC0_9BILA|nr:unnamed protein product [Rotaria socialis]CAF3415872.1 unnamed protein product [Rotaria socialis]CAF4188733.1 unnamed protein product [Rotaria socialis]CAF4808388.1 unnamed protein product [Rotaria socialis]